MGASRKRSDRGEGPLSVEAWCRAAMALMIREGAGAVAVEPLTRALGVTKGSFYWHFSNRDALVETTLARWETDQTQDMESRMGGIRDPRARLRILMFAAFEDVENGLLFASLSASSQDPRVEPFLRRVSERRLAFVTEAFQSLGLPAQVARERALFAYAAYVGYFHLLRAMPGEVRRVTDLSGYVRQLADALVP